MNIASPQDLFTLQVLGAAAQLERALIYECTKAECEPSPFAANALITRDA